MGKTPSPEACSEMMGFLLTWHAERLGMTVPGAKGVLREEVGLTEADDRETEVLRVGCESGVWQVEVRLPGGVRAAAACRGSFQQARAKAVRLGRLAGRRAAS